MAPPSLRGSVGKNGANARQDVLTVQQLINGSLSVLGYTQRLTQDGLIGPKTISAIEAFQKQVLGLPNPDARVDPGKRTLEQLWIQSVAGGIVTRGVFLLEVHRKRSSLKSVIGDLMVGGERICDTLELPWRWNRQKLSCIPFGEYSGTIRTDGTRGWRIQLSGVPGRSLIQIHIGNYPTQIEGCILVGMETTTDAVLKSGDALKLLRTLFEKASKPSIRVRITGAVTIYDEMKPPGGIGSTHAWA